MEVVQKFYCPWIVSSRSFNTKLFNQLMGVVYYGVKCTIYCICMCNVMLQWLCSCKF